MPQTNRLTTAHRAAYLILCAIWGSTWMAIRVVVRDIPPIRAAAFRFSIAAVALGVIALVRKVPLPKNPREWRATAILSITMMAIPYGLIFWAEQYISSSITAVLYSSSPLFAALLTPAMTGRPVPRRAIYSLLVGVGGIVMLFDVELRVSTHTLIGGAAVLIGVLASSWSTVFAKRETSEVHPIMSTALQLVVGGIALEMVSLAKETGKVSEWTTPSISALIFLAIFGSAMAFALYYWLLRSMDAYKASTINLVVPFVAIIEGALILHEMITAMMLFSAVVVLGAVGIVLKAQMDELQVVRLSAVADEGAEP